MTRTYKELQLNLSVGFNPDWSPAATLTLRNQHAYAPPTYQVTREGDSPVYLVRHVATGRECEVPVAVVRWAELAAPAPADEADPDPIAEVPTVLAKRGPGRPRKTPSEAA